MTLVYNLDGVTLEQHEIDAVIAALRSRSRVGQDCGRFDVKALAADSALQKFLDVERRVLAPTVAPESNWKPHADLGAWKQDAHGTITDGADIVYGVTP